MEELLSWQIAYFIKNTKYENLPLKLIELSKEAFIDYIAVTIAGKEERSILNIKKYIKTKTMLKEATIFGCKEKSSVEYAAMINAMSAHVLDYDDVSWTTIGHPTAVVASVAFAMAEKYKKTPKELILAYALGVEVMHKLAQKTMPNISQRGWHTTCVYGVFGAVVAASILKNSSFEEIINAIGIAASKASGIRSNFGTNTKAYHAGLAASNGIDALYLATYGLNSSNKALEDKDGFIQNYADIDLLEDSNLKLGENWDLLEFGLVFKQYPCCSGSHPAADLVKDLTQKYLLESTNIEKIEVGCSLLAQKELICDFPTNALEAKFSMRYAIASMIIYKNLSLEEFSDEKVKDKRVQELMKKIDISIDSEFKKLGFIGTSPVRIKIKTKNREIEETNYLAKGNPQKKLTKEEIKDKFFQCTKSQKNQKELFNLLKDFEQKKDLSNFLKYIK
ncbi:MmgE/PrpD family protein [Halarcobacter ebronensis]|uniref:2-methylcitrate dehydratase n=1 Tax=Halarcobacter ebronensis TaxID=1462615 RepID=A0A4Q1AMZ7_9BACT|nr:MmgE/PrpD family protein [Halarcobacter ebronensis]QKF81539.1 MmgE/PrpD family protein [Halarcobacter ebronensis]RXK05469.1 2-methylcitrate dehydratase [Halarcobacter ebronensis]